MEKFFIEQYLHQFNIFINELKNLFIDHNINDIDDDIVELNVEQELEILENLPDDDKINKGIEFNNLLSDELFDLFLKCKIKVFSHKMDTTLKLSESLFNNKLTLRNLLNIYKQYHHLSYQPMPVHLELYHYIH